MYFLGYEFNVMAVSGAVWLFTKIVALKTLVKSVTVAFFVKYINNIHVKRNEI